MTAEIRSRLMFAAMHGVSVTHPTPQSLSSEHWADCVHTGLACALATHELQQQKRNLRTQDSKSTVTPQGIATFDVTELIRVTIWTEAR